MSKAPATHYAPAARSQEQVAAFLAKCAKTGSDKSAARLLLKGNLTVEAMAYVVNYLDGESL